MPDNDNIFGKCTEDRMQEKFGHIIQEEIRHVITIDEVINNIRRNKDNNGSWLVIAGDYIAGILGKDVYKRKVERLGQRIEKAAGELEKNIGSTKAKLGVPLASDYNVESIRNKDTAEQTIYETLAVEVQSAKTYATEIEKLDYAVRKYDQIIALMGDCDNDANKDMVTRLSSAKGICEEQREKIFVELECADSKIKMYQTQARIMEEVIKTAKANLHQLKVNKAKVDEFICTYKGMKYMPNLQMKKITT